VYQATTRRCRNCASDLHGPYCHACGQKDLDPEITVREVVSDVVSEAASLDGKVLRTLRWLLGRPGRLTLETLDGRRARWASPFRLYLACSVLFFALAAAAPRPDSVITFKGDPPAPGATQEEILEQQRFEQQVVDEISAAMIRNVPRAMFVLMPFFAILTWLFYRRSRGRFIPHLYYSLHFHSVVFLLLAATVLLSLAGDRLDPLRLLLPVSVAFYHFTSLRRVFGGSVSGTALKGTLIGILYAVALALVLLAVTYPVFVRTTRGEP
jgi:hypothetical protein